MTVLKSVVIFSFIAVSVFTLACPNCLTTEISFNSSQVEEAHSCHGTDTKPSEDNKENLCHRCLLVLDKIQPLEVYTSLNYPLNISISFTYTENFKTHYLENSTPPPKPYLV